MTYAFDTNTLIYLFKGVGRVGDRVLQVSPQEIAVPSIVLYELEVGIAQSTQPAKRRRQLDTLLEVTSVLPFDSDSAKSAAAIHRALRAAGTPIGPRDVLIAGTALAHHATLVTRNVREFRRIQGLSVVDWF